MNRTGIGNPDRAEKKSLTLGLTGDVALCSTTTPRRPDCIRTSVPVG